MKRYINLILVVVITLLTITAMLNNATLNKTNSVNSIRYNNLETNKSYDKPGFIHDNYYNVNIKP